jgi:hypothetical protein
LCPVENTFLSPCCCVGYRPTRRRSRLVRGRRDKDMFKTRAPSTLYIRLRPHSVGLSLCSPGPSDHFSIASQHRRMRRMRKRGRARGRGGSGPRKRERERGRGEGNEGQDRREKGRGRGRRQRETEEGEGSEQESGTSSIPRDDKWRGNRTWE